MCKENENESCSGCNNGLEEYQKRELELREKELKFNEDVVKLEKKLVCIDYAGKYAETADELVLKAEIIWKFVNA